jgi:hypothetical protein
MKKRQIKNRFPELDEPGRFGTKFYGFDGKPMTMGQWTSMTEDQIQAVGSTYIRGQHKTYWISTVLLGIDYSFGAGVKPIIFETMVFEKAPDGIREIMGRYTTIQQARKGHRKVVRGMRLMLTERARLYGPLLNNGSKP